MSNPNEKKNNHSPCITVILAAGKSTRFKKNKLITPIAGKPVIEWCMDSLSEGILAGSTSDSGAEKLDVNESSANKSNNAQLKNQKILVLSPTQEHLQTYTNKGFEKAVQNVADGTAGALIAGLEHAIAKNPNLEETKVIVACGDMPCLTPETTRKFYETLSPGLTIGVSKMYYSNHHYGVIEFDESNKPCNIIEYKERSAIADAEKNKYTQEQPVNTCQLINTGLYAFNINIKTLLEYIKQIPSETHGEKYLTKIVSILYTENQQINIIELPIQEMYGVNTEDDYRMASYIISDMLRQKALKTGAYLHDPHSIHLQHDTILEAGCEVHPYVCFGAGVHICSGATVLPFTVISGSKIGGIVGPFAHIRDGTITEGNTHLGAFVETKDAYLEEGAKAKHHSYLGNCRIGQNSNIGAGVITCNYNGREKHHTQIGENVDVGANTSLIAPVTLGNNSQTGASSVISHDVPDNTLSVTRIKQRNLKRIFVRNICDGKNECKT